MRAVNLLPRDVVSIGPVGLPKAVPIVGACAVPAVALGLVIVGVRGAHSVVAEKTRELAALQVQVQKAAKAHAKATPVRPVVDTAALIQARSARLTALEAALAKEIPWDDTMREIARVVPSDVWFTSMSLVSPSPANPSAPTPTSSTPGATPTTMTLQGEALGEEGVAALLTRLQLVPSLSNVALGTTAQSSVGAKTVVQFTITGSIAAPVTPPATTPTTGTTTP